MGPLPHLRAKSAQRGRPAEELTDHLAAGLAAAQALRERVGRIEALTPVFGEDFWTAVLLGILCHDCGKVCEGFQDVVWGRAKSWGQRHEVVSLGWLPALIPDPGLRRWVAAAVATHHRPLTDERGRSLTALYGDVSLEEFRTLVEPLSRADTRALASWLAATAQGVGLPVASAVGPNSAERQDGDVPAGSAMPMDVAAEAHHQLSEVLENWWPPAYDPEGLGAVLLQGAVTLADHLSSAHGSLHSAQPLGPDFPALLAQNFLRQGRELREHQKRAAGKNGHLLLRAPTGSGKTEAGLLWSSTQVGRLTNAGRGVPRVFYTLPYLASINSMAHRLGKLLGGGELIGVAHSRAASYHLATAITPEDDEADRADAARKAVSRAEATRLFRETVRVGTPYQLMRGALAGPSHASVLIDAANSVFVLDELHAYDPKRLGYLLAMASFWDRLGGSVAVLSATLPQALADLFRETLGEDVPEIDTPDLGLPPRHRLRTRSHHLTDPAAIAEIGERIREGRSVLVVANSIKDAQHLFDELAPVAGDEPDAAVLLHSRFRRKDRLDIEERLRDRYSTGSDRKPGLVVATQVVEVSLDVDFDMLFTSAAPLEALLQRFGRVNRVGLLPPADVIVHAPVYAPRRKGQEDYADGVYPREPVEAGFDILLRHQDAVVDEAQATTWLNDVYATPWGGRWSTEVRECRKAFQDTFLTFDHPFHDRSDLTEAFDELFDGTEAIWQSDLESYREALDTAGGAAGRLLAEDYLIPMPYWAAPLTSWERELGIRIVAGDYDEHRGLLAVHGPVQASYRLGELI